MRTWSSSCEPLAPTSFVRTTRAIPSAPISRKSSATELGKGVLSKKIGIDLGTSSVTVYVKGEGIVLREPPADDRAGPTLQRVIGRVIGRQRIFRPDVMLSVPGAVTGVERRAVLEELVRGLEEVIGLAPPAVAPALARNGLVLTGGAAQLPDLDRFLGGRLRLPVVVARNAQACVATGTGLALDNLQMIRRGQHYIT